MSYKGNRAGAIAAGFFVGGSLFVCLSLLSVLVVVMPEGGARAVESENVALAISLTLSAIFAGWAGWVTKRFFDRRAGRQ
ncbi:hypothetical protein FHS91_002091 [Sphingobium xanthum]|uniref:hypothetical protein n=1 Tax=Sphingobium xanthum TaxID=1387165 RepID=UPI001C8C29F6|nr:hypothetical protein [Sphingobium xanthum]